MSVNFHLPGIMPFYEINTRLLYLLKEHPEYFYPDINITGIYGVFGSCLWNGGREISKKSEPVDISRRKEIITEYNSLGAGILYTFTNKALSGNYHDPDCLRETENILCDTKLNKIIVADEGLKDYIEKEFPGTGLKFILSTTSEVVIKSPLHELESKEKEYDLIVPNHSYNNTEELFHVKNPRKYEILLSPQCVDFCPYEEQHYLYISKLNLPDTGDLELFKCPHEKRRDSMFSLEELSKERAFVDIGSLYSTYADCGFGAYKINGRNGGALNAASAYVYYMVQPEYVNDVFRLLIKASC